MKRIIVRRGRFLTFELLRRTFGGDPNVEIIWDRRKASSNVGEPGAEFERRSRPPEQWYRLDYLLTTSLPSMFSPPPPAPPTDAPAPPPPSKPSTE